MPADPRPPITSTRLGQLASLDDLHLTPELAAIEVTGVCLDSRRVQAGDLYAALPGAQTHGAAFVEQARDLGAAAVLTDPAGFGPATVSGLPTVVHPDPRRILGEVSAAIYGTSDLNLQIIGVTGTNGKTTLSYLLESGLLALGHQVGIIGTTGIHIRAERLPSARTTPESPDVHALLAVMASRGVTTAVMEVSSHALALGRVDGVIFDVALFTNLSQDHLDFHADMADYFAAKAQLFEAARAEQAVVCLDDRWGRRLADGTPLPVITYATERAADWTFADVQVSETGAWSAEAVGPNQAVVVLESSLPGRFNQANALGALAVLAALGADPALAARGIGACEGVPGRMEPVPAPDLAVFVDYAHTPDAVERVIGAVRQFCRGRITVVLGCGGDRDHAKRPLMGRVAAEGADRLIVTDDNPRSEDPKVIREEMLSGAQAVSEGVDVIVEGDRRAAIRTAIVGAAPGDCVLVLGKGHETGQEISGVLHPFSDRDEATAAIAARGEVRR